MSFMYNPYPYDDWSPVNSPKLESDVITSIEFNSQASANELVKVIEEKINGQKDSFPVVAFEGYIGAEWKNMINLVSQRLELRNIGLEVINFADCFKASKDLDEELDYYLHEDKIKDPVSLFGKVYKGGYEGLLDKKKIALLKERLEKKGRNKVVLIYGNGCAIKELRAFYNLICYFDITPKTSILRAREGKFANLGDQLAKPVKKLIRRCYYVDFECAFALRRELFNNHVLDFYVTNDNIDEERLLSRSSLEAIFSSLVSYPFRCKPVYMEGVWGGYYIKHLRNLPEKMRNCAWVFDLIPSEVSILVQVKDKLIEFPFYSFVQMEGESMMGKQCMKDFKGYFPIRFNYDDTFHSNGNMSIQVHSGHDYNIQNYNEFGRQDESYYVVVTGHNAKTYVGFNEDASPDEFINKAKQSEKDCSEIDYQKYINHVKSKPGTQVLLPAGTIHSSGRNQVVLEIGSLTIGSYTYKLYDYVRKDLDGNPRPIHTWHGERVVCKDRTTSWVNNNLVQDPQIIASGNGWTEYSVGKHDLMYFCLRRLEFEKEIKGDTKGNFHVLSLVDGEKIKVRSIKNPDKYYIANYMDIIVVPANMGEYVIENMGDQPVCVHKTMLKYD